MEALKTDNGAGKAAASPAGSFYRRIGGTLFVVRVYTGSGYADTPEEKISRLICNEVMTGGGNCGMMETPQMSQPLERSSE